MEPPDFPLFDLPAEPARRSPTIERLNHRHEQIANWLILNPHATLGECAAHFNYTRAHLSRIIHSDAFRSLLESKNKEVFATICQTTPQRLAALADLAIEKVTEHLERSESPDFALDVFDKTLHRLGYGPQQQRASVQQQFLFVNSDDLAAARQLIIRNDQGSVEAQVGQALPSPTSVPESEQTARAETPGR